MIDMISNNNVLQTFYFQKFSLLFSRNETRPNPLSELWQIAVQSALNLEINHCFPPQGAFFTNFLISLEACAVNLIPANHISKERLRHLLLPCFDCCLLSCHWPAGRHSRRISADSTVAEQEEAFFYQTKPTMTAGGFPHEDPPLAWAHDQDGGTKLSQILFFNKNQQRT